jgi:hypothetical protein
MVRKTSSVFLIALMLFINAVKLFHMHPGILRDAGLTKTHSVSQSPSQDFQQIKQNDRCAICDFQLARDADPAQIIIAIAPLSQAASCHAEPLHESLDSFYASRSGRGPPSLA